MTQPERRDAPWIVAAFVFVAIVIVVGMAMEWH